MKRWMLVLILLCCGVRVWAQSGIPAGLQDVGVTQKLNQTIPLDTSFVDENGKTVRLHDYFGDKPVILSLAYLKCPMLCPYVLNGLAGSLKAVSFQPGKDFTILTVSFDPSDTPSVAATNKEKYVHFYGKKGAQDGWHFLTGSRESIEQLTRAVGFRYQLDPSDGQFAHASAIMVLTPNGKLARYFFGIEYPPRDLRLALVEASQNKIGNPVDQLLLFCFHYDPSTGKYSATAVNIVRLGGILTVCALGIFIAKNLKVQKSEKHV
jgi:protein SCO1